MLRRIFFWTSLAIIAGGRPTYADDVQMGLMPLAPSDYAIHRAL